MVSKVTTKRFLALVIVFAVLFSLTACTSGDTVNASETTGTSAASESVTTSTSEETQALEGEYKIGVILPLTGAKADAGQDAQKGIDLAIGMINDQGGVQGKKLEAIYADGNSVETATAETQRLIEIEKVKVITGTYDVNVSNAVSAICEQNKVFFLELANPSDALLQRGFRYVFRMNPTASDEGYFAAQFLVDSYQKLGVSDPKEIKIALVGVDNVYGQSIYNGALAKLEELGMEPAYTEIYSSDVTDLSSLIMKLKDVQPDAVISASLLNDAALFYRQAYQLGFDCKAFVGNGAGFGNKTFYEQFGSLADDVFCTNYTIETSPASTAPGMQDFFQLYRDTYNQEPVYSHIIIQVGQGMMVLGQIINAAANIDDPDSLVESALAIDIPSGTMINGWGAHFAGPDAELPGQNIAENSVIIAQWQDGKLWQVYPEESEGIDIVLPQRSWDEKAE